jgi:hypothetical protein
MVWLLLLLLGGGSGGAAVAGAQTAVEPAAVAAPALPSYQVITDLIAGNPVPAEELAAWVNPAGFRDYVAEMQQIWQRFEKQHLQPLRQWADRELAPVAADAATAFYPFSGPDLVNLLAFFPHAKTYVMLALEPVGTLPRFRPGANEGFYHSLEYALNELLHFNFFFTEHMASDLRRRELDGVLPVLLFFLGREQVRVHEVTSLLLPPEGPLREQPAAPGEKFVGPGVPGVKIVFRRGPAAPAQTLYYFSFNLQNGSWRQAPHFVAFLESLAPYQTLVKAASYLMFKGHYSHIRDFILTHSQVVLQTDEGIPVRYFEAQQWERRLYGVYKQPIALFRNCYQPDLAALYRQQQTAPLPFGVGYHHRRHTSNLMLARRLLRLVEEGGN